MDRVPDSGIDDRTAGRGRLPGVDIDGALMRHVAGAIEHGHVVDEPPVRTSS